MNFPQIMPECYADTVLVEKLGFSGPNHQLSIGKVFSTLEDKSWKNRQVVGIVDDDKKKGNYLENFQPAGESEGIKRYVRAKHTVLVISPEFEDWVFANANAVGVDPAKYGFSDRKTFQRACKRIDAGRDQKLLAFFNTLKQKKAPGFIQLQDWICEGAGIGLEDLF